MFALESHESVARKFARDLQQMLGSGFDIKSFGRIGDPDCSAGDSRLPVDFATKQLGDVLVPGFAEYPLAALEVIVPAGELHWNQFAGFGELQLAPIYVFAQGVDDLAFRVF